MTLRKVIVALLLMAAPLLSVAQKGCKFDEEKKDPFSGGNFRTVGYEIGPGSWNWKFTLEENDHKLYVIVRMLRGGKILESFAKGQKIMLKLASGKILELTADQEFLPIYAYGTDGFAWTNYIPKFEVSKEFMTDLGSSPITDFKVTLGPQTIMLPKITEKQTSKIMGSAKCLTQ